MLTRRVLCVIGVAAGAAFGQAPPADDAAKPAAPAAQPAATPAAPAPAAEEAKAKRERMLRASRLPNEARACREKGVPDEDMKGALRAAKRKGLKADEMSDLTTEQRKAVDEHGPVDNFGAFVQTKLDEGLRGKDLAAAIKAEHVKRGKGKGYKAKGKDAAKPGKPTDDTAAPGKGKDDDADRSKGKPEDKPGKPDDKGKGKGKGGG